MPSVRKADSSGRSQQAHLCQFASLGLLGHTGEGKNLGGFDFARTPGDEFQARHAVDRFRAVRQAADNAKDGDTVLLAPSGASFDQYDNFEKRGDDFIRCVREIEDNNV